MSTYAEMSPEEYRAELSRIMDCEFHTEIAKDVFMCMHGMVIPYSYREVCHTPSIYREAHDADGDSEAPDTVRSEGPKTQDWYSSLGGPSDGEVTSG